MSGPRSILSLFGPPVAPGGTDAAAVRPTVRAPGTPPLLTVSQACSHVKRKLDGWGVVTLRGEVADLRKKHHWYFMLKDPGASVQAVLYERDSRWVKFPLEAGMRVDATGRFSFFEPRGTFQLHVTHLLPAGQGEAAAAYEALRLKLEGEGLFSQTRKKPLPPAPRVVGVVTSAEGAALHDILNVTRRRAPGVHILLAPARVQGVGAAAEVMAALRRLDASGRADVIIVGRGGGSAEDLAAFNDEALARAVAACRTPVISAVGHQTDVSICDWVADVRAPTPSAAAECAVPNQQEAQQRLEQWDGRLQRAVAALRQQARMRLLRLEQRLGDPGRLVGPPGQRLDEARGRLTAAVYRQTRVALTRLTAAAAALQRVHPAAAVRQQRGALANLERALQRSMHAGDAARRTRLELLQSRLAAAHPAVRVRQQRARVTAVAGRLTVLGPALLAARRAAWETLARRVMAWQPGGRLEATRRGLERHEGALWRAVGLRLGRERGRLGTAAATLDTLSPLAVLQRGYALVETEAGVVVRAPEHAPVGTLLKVRLATGQIHAQTVKPGLDTGGKDK